MPYDYTTDQGRATVRLQGELDHHEALTLMQDVGELIEMGLPSHVQMDLSGLTFMDSSGIAVVVQTFRRSRDIGAQFEVTGTPARAMRIFTAAGINKIVTFK